MKYLVSPGIILAATAGFLTALPPPVPRTCQVKLNGHTFTLPAGFEIQLAAGPPLVNRPIVADFDDQGRLYVADSSGTNEPVAQQLQKRPHRILRLEDANGNGRFDRSTVFADHMMFPEGVMCLGGSVYVAAPPSIWKLTDSKGTGVADQRVEWFQGKTLTGCANDLHGPYRGPDGWIYWCKGAFAKQTYERPGRPPFVTRAAHIFRCRPDGSGIEPVMTGGMDNPVAVVFTPGGERIFTTTFFQHPGGGLRDGLVHAIYGGVYGKDHDVIYEHPWTAPSLMPVLTHMGAAAPCGLVRYESAVFGAEYQDNLFACQFNMHKVSRHVLEPRGATFQARDEDFLVSDNLDFHPTDVREDADGSLLVLDTGGWYKLCCPTSQLHKPDVLGAIYRIRRTGAPRPDDPRGRKLAWSRRTAAELGRLLDDPRPAIRRRAIESLAHKGVDALPALEQLFARAGSAEAFRNAIWVATRIDHPRARLMVHRAMAFDDRESVRQVALHSVSVRRDRDAVPTLIDLLKSRSLHNRRAAAEALGRIGDRSAVPPLLEAAGALGPSSPSGQPDRVLEHSLTFALIEIGDADAVRPGLASPNPRTRRAALVALDQMEGGRLKAQDAAQALNAADPALKEAAWWIVSRHPDWGGTLAGFLRERLSVKNMSAGERDGLARELARLARARPTQELLAQLLRDPSASRETRQIALRAMADAGLREASARWLAVLRETLSGDDRELLRDAVGTARALHLPKKGAEDLLATLLRIGQDPRIEDDVRLPALAAVPSVTVVEPPLFDYLCSRLRPSEPPQRRGLAADVLARAKLTGEQLRTLVSMVEITGPMEVNRLLEAFVQSTDDELGRRLVAALKNPAVRPGLREEAVRRCLAKFGPAVQKQAEELYASLGVDVAGQKARLDELLTSLKNGDVRRGQAVFNSPKAACASCHAIGYLGGKVGPDLTHIGKIRSERDLLESIVFPSASFVRSYEPVVVETRSGKVHNGLVRKDTPDEVVLVTGATDEVRIPRDDIEDMRPSKVSIMPAGLDRQLTPGELADLVAFLKACQ